MAGDGDEGGGYRWMMKWIQVDDEDEMNDDDEVDDEDDQDDDE